MNTTLNLIILFLIISYIAVWGYAIYDVTKTKFKSKNNKIFGLNESQFEGIKESRKSSDKLNPYIVLGCSSNDDFATVRKKYLHLSKEHHPDMLMNKGVPKEVIEESKKKMRAINSAFDQIEKMIASGAPQEQSWRAGFALMVTVVWLYLEVLRLISILRRD